MILNIKRLNILNTTCGHEAAVSVQLGGQVPFSRTSQQQGLAKQKGDSFFVTHIVPVDFRHFYLNPNVRTLLFVQTRNHHIRQFLFLFLHREIID